MEFLPFILLVFSLVCCTNGFVVDRRGAPSSLTKQNLDEAHIINIINSHVDQHGEGQHFGSFVCGTKQVVTCMFPVCLR